MLKFRCGCGQKIGVPESYVGHLVRCPRCARAVPVPAIIDVKVEAVEAPRAAKAQAKAPPVRRRSTSPDQMGAEAAAGGGDQSGAVQRQPTFSFDLPPGLMSELGADLPGGGPVPGPQPAGGLGAPSASAGAVAWDAGVMDPDDPAMAATGLAAMVEGPHENPAFERFLDDESSQPLGSAEMADEGRALSELMGIDAWAGEAPPDSAGQVSDLLRDLSDAADPRAPQSTPPVRGIRPAPAPHSSASTQTKSGHGRRVVPMLAGALSVVTGLGAVGLCAEPRWARFAVPAGTGGLVLAAWAMVASSGRRRAGVGLGVGGAVLSVLGIGLAVAIASGKLPRIDLHRFVASGWRQSPIIVAPAPNAPVARAAGIEVRVTSAKVVRPAVYAGGWHTLKTLSQPCLQITLALRSVAGRERIEYHSWGRPRTPGQTPSLADADGDPLKMLDLSPLVPVGGIKGQSVYLGPGRKGASDVLLFEQPPRTIRDLELQLPGANVGAPDSTLRIEIPASMVKR